MNFVLETLMQFKPDQISKMFLFYDCQPFSESFITKAIFMLLKYYSTKPEQYFRVFNNLCSIFRSIEQQAGGQSSIYMMLEHKSQAKKFAKELNAKYKNFINQVEEQYAYIDAATPANVSSKLLAYSREV